MKTNLLLVGFLVAAPAALASFDRDANGLSDLFEFIYFHGPADPAGDPDGDGNTTLEEMIWGTDPTQLASRVSGATAYVEGMDLVLVWPAAGLLPLRRPCARMDYHDILHGGKPHNMLWQTIDPLLHVACTLDMPAAFRNA